MHANTTISNSHWNFMTLMVFSLFLCRFACCCSRVQSPHSVKPMAQDNCPSDGCVVVLAVVIGCHSLSFSCITVNVSLQKLRIVVSFLSFLGGAKI